MKKSILISFYLILLNSGHAQLISGSLVDEGRKLITQTDFSISDNNAGIIFCELAVNRKGLVTSVRMLNEGTTVTSTPTRINVHKYLKGLQFEEGTWYPEFQHVKVKVTIKRPA